MASACMKFPHISLSNLTDESSLRSLVCNALEEYGCFQVTFDDIPVQLRESVLDGVKQVFDLLLEIKLRTRSSKPYEGYIGQRVSFPLHESLAIEDVLSPQKVDNFINVLWAEGHPDFWACVTMLDLVRSLISRGRSNTCFTPSRTDFWSCTRISSNVAWKNPYSSWALQTRLLSDDSSVRLDKLIRGSFMQAEAIIC